MVQRLKTFMGLFVYPTIQIWLYCAIYEWPLGMSSLSIVEAHLDHSSSYPSTHEHSQAVEEKQPSDGSDEDEPEPEEDVDLLIDDVER